MKYSVENSAVTTEIESYNDFGGVSAEGFPRLPGVSSVKLAGGGVNSPLIKAIGGAIPRSILSKSLDEYLSSPGVKKALAKIKEYCEKKHWSIVGLDGLQKNPTLWTYLFKAVGSSFNIANGRKNTFERTVDGVKIVVIYTDNKNDSHYAKTMDVRSGKDWFVLHLVLSKKDGESTKYFTKQISNRVYVKVEDKEGVDNRKANYRNEINVNANVNKGNESLLPIATSSDGLRFFDL